MKRVKVKLIHPDAKFPRKATMYSSGYDLFACEYMYFQPGSFITMRTGISIEMENDMEAQIRPRSGLAAKYGVTVLNAPGTIDADYRGEIKVILINHSSLSFEVTKGMRIAQMVFAKVEHPEIQYNDDLNKTERGAGGFGSTGLS